MTTITETRRRQILQAAAACFVRRGFHQSTMQEICREAGLSPGSVYRYFKSKEEIIGFLVEESCHEFLILIESVRNQRDVATAFEELTASVLDKIRDQALCILHIEADAEALRNPAMAEIVGRNDEMNLSALSDRISEAQSTGAMDPKLDPHMTAEILIALITGLAMRKSLNRDLDTLAHAPIIITLITRFLLLRRNP